jgi:hypothetical protein
VRADDPEGGICGPCQHYGKECIVPLKKTSARDSNGPGYKILSMSVMPQSTTRIDCMRADIPVVCIASYTTLAI